MRKVAQTLVGIGPTDDGKRCVLRYKAFGGKEGSLEFPSDQLEALIGRSLQVERKRQEGPSGPEVKYAQLARGVEIAIDTQTQNVLLDFFVGNMRFAFSLPREHAVGMMEIIKTKLPVN
jgi:hypothetical protein